MSNREQVLNCLYGVVEELNEQRSGNEQLPKEEGTAITGPNAGLDSLGFLNLVMGLETRVAEDLGGQVSIAERLMAGEEFTPPETLGALADLLTELQQA